MGATYQWFKNLNTPSIMSLMIGGISVLCLITGIITHLYISQINYTIKTIKYDSKPSVESAQNIQEYLTAMYADVVNDLLTNSPIGLSDDLTKLNKAIVSSTKNITFSSEEYYINDIQKSLTHLYTLIGELRTTNPDDRIRKFMYNSNIEHLMLYATRLEQANSIPLENSYQSFQETKSSIIVGMFIIVIISLISIQVWLMKKTNRIINPSIFVATGIISISLLWILYAIIQEQISIRVAKEDAYNSLHELYNAKATLNAMNADESMWLLDNVHGFDITFFSKAKKVLDIDFSKSTEIVQQLDAALLLEKQDRADDAKLKTPKLTGNLGEEISNITFGIAERKPATDAVKLFISYMDIDNKIRTLAKTDKNAAIKLCIGNNEGQSNWTFERLMKAIDAIILENETEFSDRFDQATTIINGVKWVSIISLVLTALFTAFGLWQRIEEFN